MLRQCKVLIKLYFHRVRLYLVAVPLPGYLAFTESALKWPPALSLKFPLSSLFPLPKSQMKDDHQQAKCGSAE